VGLGLSVAIEGEQSFLVVVLAEPVIDHGKNSSLKD
jgi:hypothetical protein